MTQNAVSGSSENRGRRVILALLRRVQVIFGLLVILFMLVVALFANRIMPRGPFELNAGGLTDTGAPLPPGGEYALGTDLLGRDLLSRLILGARTSIIIGLLANTIAVVIGAGVGVIAGYTGGIVGSAMMRFTDLIMAFPALLLAIVLASIFRPSLMIVVIVIAMVNWVQMARVIFTETRSLAERDFIQVQRSIGSGALRILFRHLLPHLFSSILVFGTLGISTTVLLEATLSYLGVGVQPPMPSWGNIIFENQTYFTSAPWLVLFPGAAILLLALAFNLVGDSLRDILDPTLQGRH